MRPQCGPFGPTYRRTQRRGQRMAIIKSAIDPASEEFHTNYAALAGQVEELKRRLAQVREGGGKAALEKHIARHKLPVRERIRLLCDEGTAFLEFSALAANGMYHDDAPAAGIVTGIGVIHGQECMIVANDATVKGGTYYPMTVKKHLRAQTIAWENALPCIYLV